MSAAAHSDRADASTMVIRVWTEPGRPDGFRARLLFGDEQGQDQSVVSAAPGEVVDAVRAWLTSFSESTPSNGS